jgi:methylmalonyl-CoA mutase N-terminal domain/subunit
LRGIDDGWFQSAIADSAYEFEKALASGDRVVVGVNKYAKEEEAPIDLLRIGPEVEAQHRTRLGELRAGRDESAAAAALAALRSGAAGDTNLMPLLVNAARANCTLGEIVATLTEEFGVYREPPRV